MTSSLFAVCKILMVTNAILGTVNACPAEKKNENKFQYGENDPDNNCTLMITTGKTDGFVIIFRLSQKRNNSLTTGFCFRLPSAAGSLQLCPSKKKSSFVYMNHFDGCDLKKLERVVESKTENYNIFSVVFADRLRRRVKLNFERNGGKSFDLAYESISCPRKTDDTTMTTLIVFVVLLGILLLAAISLIIWMKRRWNRNSRNDTTLQIGETGGVSTGVGCSAFSRLTQPIPPPPARRSLDERFTEFETEPDRRRTPSSQHCEAGRRLPERPAANAYEDIEIGRKKSQSPTKISSVQSDKLPMEEHNEPHAFMAHETPENNITFSAESDQEDEEPYSRLDWDPPNTQRFIKHGERTTTSHEDSTDDMVKVNDDRSDCVTQDMTSLEEIPTKVQPIDTARHNSENSAMLVELISSEKMLTVVNENREESQDDMNDTYLNPLNAYKTEGQVSFTSMEGDVENRSKESGPLSSTVSRVLTLPTPGRSILETIAAIGEDIDQLDPLKVEVEGSKEEQSEESAPLGSAVSHVSTLPTPSRSMLVTIAAVGEDFSQFNSHKVENQESKEK